MGGAFFKSDRAMMPVDDFPDEPKSKTGAIGIIAVAPALVFHEKFFCLIGQNAIALISVRRETGKR